MCARYIFVVIFTVELAARYNFENGWRMLLSPWNLFDFLLLWVSFVDLYCAFTNPSAEVTIEKEGFDTPFR